MFGSLFLVVASLVIFPIPEASGLPQGSGGVWKPIPGGLLIGPLPYSSGIPLNPQAYHYILRRLQYAHARQLRLALGSCNIAEKASIYQALLGAAHMKQ